MHVRPGPADPAIAFRCRYPMLFGLIDRKQRQRHIYSGKGGSPVTHSSRMEHDKSAKRISRSPSVTHIEAQPAGQRMQRGVPERDKRRVRQSESKFLLKQRSKCRSSRFPRCGLRNSAWPSTRRRSRSRCLSPRDEDRL